MKRLLVFRGFPHDPQGVLAAVYRLALVVIKLCLNVGFRIQNAGLKLHITAFANAYGGERSLFHDPQFALLHDRSLAHLADGRNDCGNQTAPVPISDLTTLGFGIWC